MKANTSLLVHFPPISNKNLSNTGNLLAVKSCSSEIYLAVNLQNAHAQQSVSSDTTQTTLAIYSLSLGWMLAVYWLKLGGKLA